MSEEVGCLVWIVSRSVFPTTSLVRERPKAFACVRRMYWQVCCPIKHRGVWLTGRLGTYLHYCQNKSFIPGRGLWTALSHNFLPSEWKIRIQLPASSFVFLFLASVPTLESLLRHITESSAENFSWGQNPMMSAS